MNRCKSNNTVKGRNPAPPKKPVAVTKTCCEQFRGRIVLKSTNVACLCKATGSGKSATAWVPISLFDVLLQSLQAKTSNGLPCFSFAELFSQSLPRRNTLTHRVAHAVARPLLTFFIRWVGAVLLVGSRSDGWEADQSPAPVHPLKGIPSGSTMA